jgi:hypothetical protein
MSNHKKNLAARTRSLLLMKEPYEMTYWKEKLHSPFYKLEMAIRNLWQRLLHTKSYTLENAKSFISTRKAAIRLVPSLPWLFYPAAKI